MTATQFERHPYNILPAMSAGQYRDLVEDIRANGLREAIVLYESKVLDGWHRMRACAETGTDCRVREWKPANGEHPLTFVKSAETRRHLTTSQRAAFGARAMEIFREEARRRQAHGMTTHGRSLPANWPEATKESRDYAGELAGVGGRSVSRAAAVMQADPEMFEQIEQGVITASGAFEQLQKEGKIETRKPKEALQPNETAKKTKPGPKVSLAKQLEEFERAAIAMCAAEQADHVVIPAEIPNGLYERTLESIGAARRGLGRFQQRLIQTRSTPNE